MTEYELEVLLRRQGYDYLAIWRLVQEIRLRHDCGIARTKSDSVGRLLRELGIDPAQIAFEPVNADVRIRARFRRYRAPIKPTNKLHRKWGV